MRSKRCTKGKSCGATCIDAQERCVLELGSIITSSLGKASTVVKKKSPGLATIFNRGIEAGKAEKAAKEKAPSMPSDMKRQLAALGAPRQLDRSPGARTRTAPVIREELEGKKDKNTMSAMMDDISRILRGQTPEKISIVTGKGAATGNTDWARGDASDFDANFKIYKRIRGDADQIDWDETVRNGRKIGEGGFGTVMRVGDVAHKRGEIGANEADIIKRVGQAGIGPRLLMAEIATKSGHEMGQDIHPGRIAMSVVPGKPMGQMKADDEVGGKKMADVYWTSMAKLHRLGIAHNDAHTDNILVDKNGTGRWVDLGLSQASPRAALAEALGVFKERKGGDDVSVPANATGQGNWQTTRWKATGAKEAANAFERGGKTWTDYKERFPVAARVWENGERVFQRMEQRGMDVNEINSVIAHGIRSPLESYNNSDGFSKINDKQAQELLNMLYDGIE